jgi:hypothetical protein
LAAARSGACVVSWSVACLALAGCERGCAWKWIDEQGLGRPSPVAPASPVAAGRAVDCPDGVARCAEGSVEASRLATIPQPCRGPEGACACPWDIVGWCDHGCAAEGVEVVMSPHEAAVQLCAAAPGDVVVSAPPGHDARAPEVRACDEGDLYRCDAGEVVDCAAHSVVASCAHGCVKGAGSVEEGIGQHPLTREAAFAILCSR